MSQSDLISKESFIAPGTEEAFINLAKIATESANQIEKAFSEAGIKLSTEASSGGIPQTTAEVKKLNVQTVQATANTKQWTAALDESRRMNKENMDTVKSMQSAYYALNTEAQKLGQNYKDLAVAQGIDSKEAKEALLAYEAKIKIIKQVDQEMGNYTRNVGNYTNSIHDALSKSAKDYRGLYTSIRALRGASYLLADALGVSVQKVNAFRLGIEHAAQATAFYKQRQADAAKATEEATAATQAATAAGAEQVVENEALAASNEEVGMSWLAWGGIIAVAAAAITGIVVAIREHTKVVRDEKDAIEQSGKALKAYNEDLAETYKLENELAVLQGKRTKAEAATFTAAEQYQEEKTKIGNAYLANLKDLFNRSSQTEEPKEPALATEGNIAEYHQRLDAYNNFLQAKTRYTELYFDELNAANRKYQDTVALAFQKEENDKEKSDAEKLKAEEKYQDKLNKAREKAELEEEKRYERQYEKFYEEWLKRAALEGKGFLSDKEEERKYDEAVLKQNVEAAQNTLNTVKNNGAGKQDVLDAEIGVAKAKYALLLKEREDAHKSFQESDKHSEQEKIDESYLYDRQRKLDEKAFGNDLLEIHKKDADAEAKEDAKRKKEELKKAKDHSKNLIHQLESMLRKYNEKTQASLEERNKILKEDADAQKLQLEAGRTNNLDSVMKQQAQNLALMQSKQILAANEYDYISILSQILTGIPKFAEGTPNTGKGGNIDGQGGFLAINHPEETILNKEQKDKVPGLAESIYFGNPDKWIVDNYLPKFKNDIPKDTQIAEMLAQSVIESNEKVVEAIKNQPFVEYMGVSRKVVKDGKTVYVKSFENRMPFQKHPAA